MEKEPFIIIMEISMKMILNDKMIKKMGKGNFIIKMVIDMKEILKMIKLMEMEIFFIIMVINMKANLKIIK